MDSAEIGHWCRQQLTVGELHAPHVLPAEVTSVFQRLLLRGAIQRSSLEHALNDLAALDILLHEFMPLTARVWDLRDSLTASDAWYVALAEGLDAPLATLDRRLARARGVRCRIVAPDAFREDR